MVAYFIKNIGIVVDNQSGLLLTKMIDIFKNIIGHRLVKKMNCK